MSTFLKAKLKRLGRQTNINKGRIKTTHLFIRSSNVIQKYLLQFSMLNMDIPAFLDLIIEILRLNIRINRPKNQYNLKTLEMSSRGLPRMAIALQGYVLFILNIS